MAAGAEMTGASSVFWRGNPGDKIGIVACSNAISLKQKETIQRLYDVFAEKKLEVVESPYLFVREKELTERTFAEKGHWKPQQRAEILMKYFQNREICAIFDLSGGDMANGILDYLDYSVIEKNPKSFFGYSDLTSVINAIYTKTGQLCGLYQARNLVGADGCRQQEMFGKEEFFSPMWNFVNGEWMEGIVTGGNIRCLLKLAGTSFFPDVTGKLLFLESMSGKYERIQAYFSQLRQMGVFDKIAGLLLGTFTEMEEMGCGELVKKIALFEAKHAGRPELPIACTREIGHGADSKCLMIGGKLRISKLSKNS